MVTSWQEGEIVWIKIEGQFLADEIIAETGKWLRDHPHDYIGYIIDVREMTERTALEQQKLEEAYKRNKSGKLRAILGNDEAFSILVSIYVRFTQAENVRYFWNEGKAKEWMLSWK